MQMMFKPPCLQVERIALHVEQVIIAPIQRLEPHVRRENTLLPPQPLLSQHAQFAALQAITHILLKELL